MAGLDGRVVIITGAGGGTALANYAGILRDGAFHEMSTENWDSVLKVHLHGGSHVTRAAARRSPADDPSP